ncbi:MAG: RHS repeat-associated core domain-containing protein, partial [Candidatus Sumerlaeia bacterium]|nr:RHS repeat-associated core domain-containing protein [Candidatus Sumerlaeia bacterium]
WDEAKVSVRAANGTLSSNAREGVAAGALLAPAVRTTQSVRAPLSAAQSSIGLKFLFTARPWTPVGEVYHLRARWYSPLEGRFLTMDPIGYDGGYNVYMYCGGDPVNWRDPWGLKKYLFYVFVRQPGEGGDRDAFETSQAEDGRVSVDPGHVFVKVYGDGELVGPIGFYPKCDGAAALGGCPGELKEDTDTNFDVEVTFEIDRCDFEETKKYIEEKQAVPPYSHPLDYNCVHFAVDCAKQAGVQLPQSQTEVRSWLLRGAFFLNTGDLGEDLRTRKQYPAGPQIPVFGIIPIQD